MSDMGNHKNNVGHAKRHIKIICFSLSFYVYFFVSFCCYLLSPSLIFLSYSLSVDLSLSLSHLFRFNDQANPRAIADRAQEVEDEADGEAAAPAGGAADEEPVLYEARRETNAAPRGRWAIVRQ